ncbi:MAG TPA: lytic transglycosylase, partial [Phenylobacterium sp.]
TWLRSLAKWGARHGRPLEARWVRFDRSGRAYVPNPAQARAVFALRYDPDLSARMAAELARENATVMAGALSRPVGPRELYAAHLLGLQGALRLIRAAEATPDLPAADLLPEAAASNARLFYEGDQPRSAATLLALFS